MNRQGLVPNGSRLGRAQLLLLLVLVVVVLSGGAASIRAFAELDRAMDGFSLAQNVSGIAADAQRDSLRLRLALVDLDERLRDPDATPAEVEGSARTARDQVAYLERQLSLLEGRDDLTTTQAQQVRRGRDAAARVSSSLDVALEVGPGGRAEALRAASPALREDAEQAEQSVARLYTQLEIVFYRDGVLALSGRRTDEAVQLGMTLVGVALTLWLAWSLRKAARRDLHRAYARLLAEADRRADAQTAALRTERRLAALVRESDDAILVVDPTGAVTFATPSAAALWPGGPAAEAVVGRPIDPVLPVAGVLADLALVARNGTAARRTLPRPVPLEVDGERRWVALTLTDLRHDPAVAGVVINAHDVTDRARREADLEHLAFHDRVTGLPNRLAVERAIDERAAPGRCQLALVDIDEFARVNERLGQAVAEQALRALAERLSSSVSAACHVGHLGDDDLTVVSDRHADGTGLARALQSLVSQPLVVGEHTLHLSCSVGVVPVDGRGHEVVRAAQRALTEAKRGGAPNAVVVHDEAYVQRAAERTDLLHALARAVGGGELRLHHQPLVDALSGEVVGTEALVRWERDGELVPPGRFVPLAEESGLVVELGAWVVDQACADLAALRAEGRPGLRVNVNVSARQLSGRAVVDTFLAATTRHGVPPSAVVVELTESAVVEDPEHVWDLLTELRGHGFRVALDDFGTGFSSLYHLMTLPVDTVKLDRSFVRDVDTSPRTRRLVSAVVDLCRDLGISVTAEGIETSDQLAAVVSAGCHTLQGYLLHRPVPLDDVRAVVDGDGVARVVATATEGLLGAPRPRRPVDSAAVV
ncbi:putative bifunctional diguanylate cyclase/phosphodiesterase [Aquipuribacter sp. SD81]|uniref:putative bifunctional diguanylate cyclase/phosphodiesterase n=1 Tax=Aquipuribacter sp. SD81 TaxID=3127703 RepID=UPI0030182160